MTLRVAVWLRVAVCVTVPLALRVSLWLWLGDCVCVGLQAVFCAKSPMPGYAAAATHDVP